MHTLHPSPFCHNYNKYRGNYNQFLVANNIYPGKLFLMTYCSTVSGHPYVITNVSDLPAEKIEERDERFLCDITVSQDTPPSATSAMVGVRH